MAARATSASSVTTAFSALVKIGWPSCFCLRAQINTGIPHARKIAARNRYLSLAAYTSHNANTVPSTDVASASARDTVSLCAPFVFAVSALTQTRIKLRLSNPVARQAVGVLQTSYETPPSLRLEIFVSSSIKNPP